MFRARFGFSKLGRQARKKHRSLAAVMVAFGVAAALAIPFAARADEREAAAKLIAHLMASGEFRPKTFRGGEWLGNGDFYLALEPAANGEGIDIVRYQTSTGTRDILVAASRLIPAGEKTPLPIEEYAFSADGQQLLVFTNSQTVWRQNTRGDYWILNLTSGALHKLGGDAPASSLMFAKFSPDNSKVGYVRGNNVYAEDLASAKITQLTQDGSATIINGTSPLKGIFSTPSRKSDSASMIRKKMPNRGTSLPTSATTGSPPALSSQARASRRRNSDPTE